MCKGVKFLIFFFSFLLFLSPLSSAILAISTLPFYDNFNDGDANGWEEHLGLGGSWNVINGEYVGSVNYNTSGNSTYALNGDAGWTNYVLEFKIKGISGVDKQVKFRYKNSGEYYALNLRSGYNDLAVKKVSNNEWLRFERVDNFNEVWYHVKVVLDGLNIKIYINDVLKFNYTDTIQPILNGKIGLEAWPGAAAAVTTVAFDEVKVTSLDSEPSFLPVPYFSQRDPAWGQDEYDHATKWVEAGEEPTMEWWGCALTSGAMTARYFGLDKTPDGEELTPKTLNKWMQDQNDANFRNGAMNWQLLSRMSKKTASLFGTNKLDLSLSKVANNFSKLDEILTASSNSFPGLPGILEVAHPESANGKHFVVAKGRSGATFGINDPYEESKNLLSVNPYNNSFDKLIWYEPTPSGLTTTSLAGDLSTILLAVDKNVDIRMIDPTIHSTGELFNLYPIGADGGTGESGEILKMLYLDKPTGGNYSIGLSSDTLRSYRLDVYLYDRNAEVKMATFVGWVGPGDQDNIYLNFDLDNVQNSEIGRFSVYFGTLREDINLSYLFGWIDEEDIRDSLLVKVDAGEKAFQKGNEKTAKNILNALLSELEAQEEKHIEYLSYTLLENDVNTLLSQL